MFLIQMLLTFGGGYYWPRMTAGIPNKAARILVQWLIGIIILMPVLWLLNAMLIAFNAGIFGIPMRGMDVLVSATTPAFGLFISGVVVSSAHTRDLRKKIAKALLDAHEKGMLTPAPKPVLDPQHEPTPT